MQELKEVGRTVGLRRPQSLFVSRNTFIVFLVIILGPTLLYSVLTISRWRGLPGRPVASTTVVTNGANQWAGDTKITAPVSDPSTPGSQEVSISPLFESYEVLPVVQGAGGERSGPWMAGGFSWLACPGWGLPARAPPRM